MPGRAAYVDGRGGSSMRLNFSGVSDDEIREGVRRIGEVVREQVALYGTLTGTSGAGTPRGVEGRWLVGAPTGPDPSRRASSRHVDAELAKVLRMPRKRAGCPAIPAPRTCR